MSASPDLSVVIPSHNREQLLLRTLETLAAQDLPADRFEVIVALDACTDGSEAAVTARDWPFALRLVPVTARNAAMTRNAGAAAARGQRIVFLDDDIPVEPGFLAAHLAAAGPAGDSVVIGPAVPDIAGNTWFDESLRGWWTRRLTLQADPGHRFGATDLATGNVSLPRALFERLGGFDTSLAVREDYELGWRVIAAGVPMVYARDARGHHRDQSDLARNLGRVRMEGKADMAFARLHPTSFPTLGIRGLAAPTTSSRVLRLLTFTLPWMFAPLIALTTAPLPALEALRLRKLWSRLFETALKFSYYRGIADSATTADEIARLASAASLGPAPLQLEVDLGDGIDAARAAVAAARPDDLTIRMGLRTIGRLPVWPGLERLEPRHLDAWLDRNRGRWLDGIGAAEALAPLPAGTGPEVPAQGWAVAELDIADWSLRRVRQTLSLPLVVLVRHGEEILGWVWVEPGPAAPDGVLAAARGALLASPPIRTALLRIAAAGPLPPPEDLPPISVVVCTRDRTDNLAECLDALAALDYPEYEIVVVDNAPSTDETARLVEGRPGIRYVREDQPGLDNARNCGFAHARHGIVAYTDDDTRADRTWLRGLARAFGEPGTDAVTGLVAPMELDGGAQNYFEMVYGGMGKGFAHRIWSRETVGARGILWASGCGVGANMAFRRDVLHRLGGFDPALDVGTATRGGGDIEVFHRLLARGHRLRYEPQAMVWHRHRGDWDALARQIEDNGSGFAAYLLTAWAGRTVPRHTILAFTLKDWIGGWLVRRLVRAGRHQRRLVLREIRGALRGPGRLRRARSEAARLAHAGSPSPAETAAAPAAEPR